MGYRNTSDSASSPQSFFILPIAQCRSGAADRLGSTLLKRVEPSQTRPRELRQAIAMFSSRWNSLLKLKLHRDNVAVGACVHECRDLFKVPKNVTKMTLKSALEDLSRTTLEALSGCLRKLEYLARLRQSRGDYSHWGFSKVYGELSARKALTTAHRAVVSEVLSTPLSDLQDDVAASSEKTGMDAEQYLERLAQKQGELLPNDPGAGSARHLSSVLHALWGLERSRERNATRRAS